MIETIIRSFIIMLGIAIMIAGAVGYIEARSVDNEYNQMLGLISVVTGGIAALVSTVKIQGE